MKKFVSFLVIVALLFSLAGCGTGKAPETKEPEQNSTETAEIRKSEQTAAEIPEGEKSSDGENAVDDTKGRYADIVIRDYGTITVELDHDAAPVSVDNFIKLAESGFYTGLTFHRIMEGFMMQGGAYMGPEENAPETIPGEFAANGWDNPLSHTAGAISMARANEFNSASSQFFIVHKDSTFLDGQYAAFGYVTEGMDVVDKICTDSKPIDNNGTILFAEQPVIESITIR